MLQVKDVLINQTNLNFNLSVEDFSVDIGERIFIHGTTDTLRTLLMMAILGFNEPEQGKIIFKGQNIYTKSYNELLRYRRNIGYSHSQNGLLKHLTIFENLMLPMQVKGVINEDEMIKRVLLFYEAFGITVSIDKEAWGLSLLDEKKILIARAAVGNPDLLLLDDPTSYLENIDKPIIMNIIDTILPAVFIDKSRTAILITTEESSWIINEDDKNIIIKENKID